MSQGLVLNNKVIPNEMVENIFVHLRANDNEMDVDKDWGVIRASEVCQDWNNNSIVQGIITTKAGEI